MSGRDERRIHNIPKCPKCEGSHDIDMCYLNQDIAGWIILEQDREEAGTVVITSEDFNSNLRVVNASCSTCGRLDTTIAANAIEYFELEIRAGRYLTWDAWTEM